MGTRPHVWLCAAWPLVAACSVVVEPSVSYRDCTPAEYVEEFKKEEFKKGASIETLAERCWRVDNNENEPSDLFVDDGDLVIRLNDPSVRADQWLDGDQAPMAFQRIDGDFVVATRVEALTKLDGDHCLPAGNMAGLVVRRAEDPEQWAVYLIGPFVPDPPDPEIECVEDAMKTRPTMAVIRSHDDSIWGADVVEEGTDQLGIGEDGEADLAICRLDNVLAYYYRNRTLDPAPWTEAGVHTVEAGALDVGPTATGQAPNFETEGHFNWAVYQYGVQGDGCRGALDGLVLPEDS